MKKVFLLVALLFVSGCKYDSAGNVEVLQVDTIPTVEVVKLGNTFSAVNSYEIVTKFRWLDTELVVNTMRDFPSADVGDTLMIGDRYGNYEVVSVRKSQKINNRAPLFISLFLGVLLFFLILFAVPIY